MLFQVLVAVMSAVMISTLTFLYRRSTIEALRGPYCLYICSITPAVLLWLADQHLCDSLHSLPGDIPNPQFHAWWHALTAICLYVTPVIEGPIRLAARGKHARIAHFLGVLPYVVQQQHSEEARRRR